MIDLMSVGAQLKRISVAAAAEEQKRQEAASAAAGHQRQTRAEKSAHVTEAILATLTEHGALTMHEVAKHLGISVHAVKHRLQALRSAKLVIKTYYGANVPSVWEVAA